MLPCVSTASVINCQDIHTHSPCLHRSADSLNRELKLLLPAAARRPWVTTAARPWERWSSRRSRCSCKKPPGLGSRGCSHHSKQPSSPEPKILDPQALHLCHPSAKASLLLPLSLVYPAKDVVKQNLWSLYSNRASNNANTAARKEGEREDVPYERGCGCWCCSSLKRCCER